MPNKFIPTPDFIAKKANSVNLNVASMTKLGSVPEGQDARYVIELARRQQGDGLIHVCLDDNRLERIANLISFFAPDITVLKLPAWDCLPYDRVSPNPSVSAAGRTAPTTWAGGVCQHSSTRSDQTGLLLQASDD